MRSGPSPSKQPPSKCKSLVVWRKFYIRLGNPPPKFRTICEVLRELYRDAEARADKLSMHKLEEAHDMAKRMQRKLMSYNKKEIYPSNETPEGGKTGDEYKTHQLWGDKSTLKAED